MSVVATIVSYIRKKGVVQMYNELLEMAYCESCGNYVPTVEDQGSLVCGYEFAEYPELATVVG